MTKTLNVTAQSMGLKRTSWIPEYWGKTECEVWGCLETHWDHLINKRVDQFIEYIHPDMVCVSGLPQVKPIYSGSATRFPRLADKQPTASKCR